MSDQPKSAARAVRPVRLAGVLLAAVLAGMVADWLRSDERLVFPRPLPEFKKTPPPP